MSRNAVSKGQVWEDNDYRRPQRQIEVLAVPRTGRNAGRVRVRNWDGREYFVAASRFRPTTRGYRLVR